MSDYTPNYLKTASPPPKVSQGQIIPAKITSIDKVDGKFGPQIQYRLDIDGYVTSVWQNHYDIPSTSSQVGRLCITLEKMTEHRYESLPEALKALKNYGVIYVRAVGKREKNGVEYPKFEIVIDTLPKTASKTVQEKIA